MKRKASLVLTLALLLLVFAGCQRNVSNSDRAASGTQSSAIDTKAASAEAKLTAAEAEKIALEHAGFTAEQVSQLHTEQDLTDYIPHYDVEFHKDNYEYDYEINAQTGQILKSEKELD